MASYKVCLSTHRIAAVSVFPSGATHSMHVEVSDVRFHDTTEYCDTRTERIASFEISDYEQLYRLLKCFGLEWREAMNLSDALEVMACDYEKRKREIDKLNTLLEV